MELIIVSLYKHSKYSSCQSADGMGQEVVSKGMSACSHGGVYSVNPNLVKVDCSSSINPLGTPKRAIAAVKKNVASLAPMYPDPECRELKKRLSHYLRVDPQWINVGNGAIEIIYWFAQAFAKNRVVIPAPTFCEYELASHKAGAKVTLVALNAFEIDADQIIEKARGADAVFLCNPNNPTGMIATREIRKIIESVGSSTKILLDECFIELTDEPNTNSMMSMIEKFENLVILRSLTKSFGLAGLRVGYSVCTPSLLESCPSIKLLGMLTALRKLRGLPRLQTKSIYRKLEQLSKKNASFCMTILED